jgi:hypothetical protein
LSPTLLAWQPRTRTRYATITKDSTGHYSKDLAVATAGVWSYVWTGTGTAPGVEDGTFTVYAAVPSSTLLAQLDELKTRLGIAQDDTADDAALLSSLLATSGWIQGTHCEDRFCQATLTQTFVAYDRYELDIPSLVSVTTLKTDDNVDGTYETTWTSGTDYQLLPYNRNNAGETKPYDKVRVIGSKTFPITYSRAQRADLVQIVGVWGWPAIPWAVHEAALVIATDTFSLKDAKFNVAGFDTFGVVRVKQNGPASPLSAKSWLDSTRAWRPSTVCATPTRCERPSRRRGGWCGRLTSAATARRSTVALCSSTGRFGSSSPRRSTA